MRDCPGEPWRFTAVIGDNRMTESLLLTIPEACRALNIGRTTLYRLIDEGRLQVRKVGRKSLILRADVERFAAELSDA